MYDSILFEIVKGYSPDNRPLWRAKKTIQEIKIILVPIAIKATVNLTRDTVYEGVDKNTPFGAMIGAFTWMAIEPAEARLNNDGSATVSWLLPLQLADFLFVKFTNDIRANLTYLDHYIHEKETNGKAAESSTGG